MRAAIFYDERMPYHGTRPAPAIIDEMAEFGDIVDTDNFQMKLQEDYDVLINLHGCFFLKSMWPWIKKHLEQGNGLISIGDGTPFSKPVTLRDGFFHVEREQCAYHRELNICQGMAIAKERFSYLRLNEDIPILKGYQECFTLQDSIGLIVKFTGSKDLPHEAGSSGPMDAVIHPLLLGTMENGRETAAPVVLIENIKGGFAGGRWIFINQMPADVFWDKGGPMLLNHLAEFTARKAYECIIRPNYAMFYPGEQPTLLIQAQAFSSEKRDASIHVSMQKDSQAVYEDVIEISISDEITYLSIPLRLMVHEGLYTIDSQVNIEGECTRTYRNGFWGHDRQLLESGEEITCDQEYFYKGGKALPIVGMTYMQSDVHRKYLYLPNAYRWDADFTVLKQAGINMIRTGVWTGYRTIMFNDGIASEEILRAIDAMILTAKRHDIPIVFNFFAFTPERWEGVNAYLDPRSIKAQKRFLRSIVSRHIKTKGVLWDLINEPEMPTPGKLEKPAPDGRSYGLMEWREWLKERHQFVEVLQERWDCTNTELPSFETASFPEERDFNASPIHTEHIKGLKVLDYHLFKHHVLNKWAAEMTAAIRQLEAKQLITIGQDEALLHYKPSPLFYQEVVDYTTNHSWWAMDALYWDSVFSKSPGKPNLIQETGIMYVQNADGSARRTEEELRSILERKYALAFAGNNAGAVQWIWNINMYMDSVNEVNIGAVRPDGTQKCEADVSYDFGEFMKSISELFGNRIEEEVAVIYPFSIYFSIRNYAVTATSKAARVLGYHLKIPFKAYSEYHLKDLGREKLIILPSPRVICQEAWTEILKRVCEGSTLLITGPFSDNEYWMHKETRSRELDIKTCIRNVNREEILYIDGKPYQVSYGDDKIAWIDKAMKQGSDTNELNVIPVGKGKVIWCPLPIEMNEQDEVVGKVYQYALDAAKVECDVEWIRGDSPGVLMKKLSFSKGSLYVFVSECGDDTEVEIQDRITTKAYSALLPANRILMFATNQEGSIVRSYRNIDIKTYSKSESVRG